ncbi:MAG: glycosyltransferase family A protein [Methyloprofundus sp.]|nr:glycosyltransferase family A protein [Methyloprofundus sp.]
MKISLIIPSYNRSHLLKRALQSVFEQSLLPDEVIVVDDGSTDDTAEMLRNLFPQVIYLHQDNAGVSSARNLGIQHSTGSWIALLDSDDTWLKDKLVMQVSSLKQSPEIKICHTEEIWIRNGTRVNAMNKHKKSGGWIFEQCLPLCAMSPSSIMIHHSIFDELGLFDESLPACEDYDLWLRISNAFPVLFLEQPLINKYGGHEDQLSHQHWGMDRFRIQALDKLLKQGQLSHKNKDLATKMLLKKARIFQKGAEKRGKLESVNHYQSLIDTYSTSQESL